MPVHPQAELARPARTDRQLEIERVAGDPGQRVIAHFPPRIQAIWTQRIVVIEEVVFARVVHPPARIVDPPFLHRVVKLRAVSFTIERPVRDL